MTKIKLTKYDGANEIFSVTIHATRIQEDYSKDMLIHYKSISKAKRFTTTLNDETAGSDVVIEVSNTLGLAVNDYCWIYGTDGTSYHLERFKVKNVVENTSITADSLSHNYNAGSYIIRSQRVRAKDKKKISHSWIVDGWITESSYPVKFIKDQLRGLIEIGGELTLTYGSETYDNVQIHKARIVEYPLEAKDETQTSTDGFIKKYFVKLTLLEARDR